LASAPLIVPMRFDESLSTSNEQALGQSCGQADFTHSDASVFVAMLIISPAKLQTRSRRAHSCGRL
jgi:hypothetical protein